jgi:hypothetical protein
VGDPAHQQRLERLRGLLDGWIEETEDQGAIPEPAGVVEYWRENTRWGSVEARGLPADISWPDLLAYWERELLGR